MVVFIYLQFVVRAISIIECSTAEPVWWRLFGFPAADRGRVMVVGVRWHQTPVFIIVCLIFGWQALKCSNDPCNS